MSCVHCQYVLHGMHCVGQSLLVKSELLQAGHTTITVGWHIYNSAFSPENDEFSCKWHGQANSVSVAVRDDRFKALRLLPAQLFKLHSINQIYIAVLSQLSSLLSNLSDKSSALSAPSQTSVCNTSGYKHQNETHLVKTHSANSHAVTQPIL